MSIRFAGSSSVHERRRRRLAQESDVAAGAQAQRAESADGSIDQPRASRTTSQEQTPLHSVIRPQLWIHVCVVALCLGGWAGMLYVGDLAEQTDLGLKSILGLRSGRLANFFSTIMLLWAGQLALLIYWYRRKSRNDFQGCYRLWLWVGVTLQFFLAVVATEAHLPFSEYMQRVWPMNVPRYSLLCWLLPVATISLAIFQLLGIETRNSASSRVLLWITGVSAAVAAGSLVVAPLLASRTGDLLQVGSATLAHLGLAVTLLFHARYVIHVSNEAPQGSRKPSMTLRMLGPVKSTLRGGLSGLRMPRLRLPRLRVPSLRLPRRKPRTKAQDKSSSSPGRPASAKAQPVKQSPTQQTEARPSQRPSPTAMSGEKRRLDASQMPKGPRHPPRATAGEQADRHESGEPFDERELDGLSKKERRRLRKQQQRTASAR